MGFVCVDKIDYKQCFSCRSCEYSCPKNVIVMKENREGFFYPSVIGDCIQCGVCVKHCPAINNLPLESIVKIGYASYLNDCTKLRQSASGGIFTALAEKIIEKKGVVFGAAYNIDLNTEHICVDNFLDLQRLKGSKYVESDTKKTYLEVKQYLENERFVLYAGTPCQIAGLRMYLGKRYNHLITIDIVCHGVPSRKLFRKYLEWLEKKNKKKIIYYGFRDKDVAGWSCGGKIKIKTEKNTKVLDASCDPYYVSFLAADTLRESCYHCPFANLNRPGDITIGDFWGIENINQTLETKDGVSFVICNTEKGISYFEQIKDAIFCSAVDIQDGVKYNRCLYESYPRPLKRDFIYNDIDTKSLDSFIKDLYPFNGKELLIRRIKIIIKAFLPIALREKIKEVVKSKR